MTAVTLRLGNTPETMTVTLVKGGDFITTLVTDDPDGWPVGAAGRIDFDNGASWDATVAGDEMTWAIDKDDVATVIAANPGRAVLVYVEGSNDLVWGAGDVIYA